VARRPTTASEQEKLYRIAARIKARRTELKVGQETASMSAGIHPNYWTRIEQARVNPTMTTMMRVAKGLNTTVTDLLDGL
jgi:transcriptional regulator with XRE-family HTH domain